MKKINDERQALIDALKLSDESVSCAAGG